MCFQIGLYFDGGRYGRNLNWVRYGCILDLLGQYECIFLLGPVKLRPELV